MIKNRKNDQKKNKLSPRNPNDQRKQQWCDSKGKFYFFKAGERKLHFKTKERGKKREMWQFMQERK